MQYYECNLLNLKFVFLKSLKIKFEYKGFSRIFESNVRYYMQSMETFSFS